MKHRVKESRVDGIKQQGEENHGSGQIKGYIYIIKQCDFFIKNKRKHKDKTLAN
ncbi:hypothetical protein [Bacillus sp. EB01]|uniref:hypothetical protein n=1 Tax=Bacillus sp. EB01 TaxID=1347086 RepID=UPI000ACC9371|nr:hypothetical protein [Bacillus sp. EB01]